MTPETPPLAPLPRPTRPLLSQPLLQFAATHHPEHDAYDVVIVGSGYGGSVAAYQLARCEVTGSEGQPPRKLRVLVLERGREFRPEDFPARFAELPRELRLARQNSAEVTGHTGLYDLRMGDDVNALVANGLGGGSLINAGVMLEPDPDALHNPHFAQHLRTVKAGGHFERARRWLGAKVKRGDQWLHNDITRAGPLPIKLRAVAELAGAQAARLPPLTVALDGGDNFAGETLPSCVHCGDCMTGCTIGAKDSLDRNLLLLAQHEGATLVTGASVTSVTRARQAEGDTPARWTLRVAHTDPRLQLREESVLHVRAQTVILAAGALGSTEILLRSRDQDLCFSQRLGEQFSCNGDNIAAVQGLKEAVNGAADEDQLHAARHVGPTITSTLLLHGIAAPPDRDVAQAPRQPERPFWLQEFSVPGPLKRLFEETVTTARTVHTLPAPDKSVHHSEQADPLAVDPVAMGKTLLVGAIGHDDARGRLSLADPTRGDTDVPTMGNLRIHWPEARTGQHLDDAHRALENLAAAAPGRSVVANPLWRLLPEGLADLVDQPRGPVLTVHPLGGCPIGRDASDGVVDVHGRVFNGSDAAASPAAAVHVGLLVLDGAIVPCSLGANPGLTIAALAAQAVDVLVQAQAGWRLPTCAGNDPAPADSATPLPRLPRQPTPLRPEPEPAQPLQGTHVRITERMGGPLVLGDEAYRVELTVAFRDTRVAELMGAQRQRMALDPDKSRLRLFRQCDWDKLELGAASDEDRRPHVAFMASLGGTLRFLHRGATRPRQRQWRSVIAWLFNRGVRDLWQASFARQPAGSAQPEHPGRKPRFRQKVKQGLQLATRAGEQRLFDYDLRIEKLLPLPGPRPESKEPLLGGIARQALLPGAVLQGQKCLTYGRRASPWTQLTQLQLTAFPGATAAQVQAAVLNLDTRFLAAQRSPLLKITQQRNQAEALAELLSLGLYLFRVLLSTHLWTFRKPDSWAPADAERQPQRAPGVISGLPEPEITDLRVGVWPPGSPRAGEALTVRLTHYRRRHAPGPHSTAASPPPPPPPLVFIHGYSVSGNTFTHPSLGSTSAAGWFWHQGRDVWVLDLRTSTALDSATWAWAMEDAALIDLPAALLHVRQLTGQRPDVFAHCIGCVMLSMALLADAEEIRRGKQELGVGTFLSAEQLGVLAAFNGPPRAPGQPHPTVRHVVLSQKGPVLRYSDDNVMRAALMQYLRRWLLQGDYQFRASARPGVGEQLLDRLLASLPYPRADYDIENPLWPCATRPWVGTRHRMDLLYGRDFNADNMAPEVLHAIDDLFGAINLDTVSQTIHFALFDAITNQRGRGEFVTQERLASRWAGINTFSISGEDNGLVSPHTQTLLSRHLQAAGIAHETWVAQKMGHQDVLIGLQRTEVFQKVEDFLRQATRVAGGTPAPKADKADKANAPVVYEPWVGPRLVAPVQFEASSGQGAQAAVGAMSRPDRGAARLMLVPLQGAPAPAGATLDGVTPHLRPIHPTLPWASSPAGHSERWLMVRPPGPTAPQEPVDWLAVLVYAPDQVPFVSAAQAPASRGAPAAYAAGPGDPDHHLPTPAERQAVQQWWDKQEGNTPAQWVVSGQALHRLQQLYAETAATTRRPLRLAVGSCQYPAGLLDEDPAGRSLLACLPPADPHQGSRPDMPGLPDLALFIGDQIYADATAGLVDPTRRDELYQQPNQRALRLPAMRRVMQHMPTHMLLDDHELVDNWEALPLATHDKSKLNEPGVQARRAALKRARQDGLAAFLRYQQMREGASKIQNALSEFQCGGHAFLLLDTRSERQRQPPRSAQPGGRLISDEQFSRLEGFLVQNSQRVKFIATPSALLPRHALSARDRADDPRQPSAAASDAWCGYPADLARLLGLLLAHDARHTVFLSGDEHHAFLAQVTIAREGGPPLSFVSVHSSALYAPFPFANGRPLDLQGDEIFSLPADDDGAPIQVQVHTRAPTQHQDGIALLQLDGAVGEPRLTVDFIGADGQCRGAWSGLL